MDFNVHSSVMIGFWKIPILKSSNYRRVFDGIGRDEFLCLNERLLATPQLARTALAPQPVESSDRFSLRQGICARPWKGRVPIEIFALNLNSASMVIHR